jgi:hypothetical protein
MPDASEAGVRAVHRKGVIVVVVEPRAVAAGRGFAWWGEGWRIFLSSPGTWIVVTIVYGIVSVLVNIVPYVGAVGHSLLTPVFVGGAMVGCRALERGEPLRVSHLFEGFQGPHFVPLMIIGAVNIALAIALLALSGGGILGVVGLGDLSTLSRQTDPLAVPLGAMTGTALLVAVLVLVVSAAFAMLNWFAPALVVLRGLSGFDAMKLSFVSCLRNWLAFLAYGLVVVVAGILLTIVAVALVFVFGAGAIMSGSLEGGIGAFIGFFFTLIGGAIALAVIVGPMAIGSVYAGFKDTLDADATVANPAYR